MAKELSSLELLIMQPMVLCSRLIKSRPASMVLSCAALCCLCQNLSGST